jgi:hypothetical protein
MHQLRGSAPLLGLITASADRVARIEPDMKCSGRHAAQQVAFAAKAAAFLT